jgi:hypothetical protein
LADEIKKYDTEGPVLLLRVDGQDFFDLAQEELERHGMKLEPAKRFVKFVKECKG